MSLSFVFKCPHVIIQTFHASSNILPLNTHTYTEEEYTHALSTAEVHCPYSIFQQSSAQSKCRQELQPEKKSGRQNLNQTTKKRFCYSGFGFLSLGNGCRLPTAQSLHEKCVHVFLEPDLEARSMSLLTSNYEQ